MGTPETIDFFDKQPAVAFPINKVENYTQRSIFKHRQITDPNPEYRRLFYPDHPNKTPQPHQSMGPLDEVRALRERIHKCAESQQKLMHEVRQNKKSQDNFQKSLDVDRRFAEMVQGSSPLFAVQDVVEELLKAGDDETRKLIPKFKEAKEQRDLRGHPCSHLPKGEMEDIIKFVKELAKGDGLLPKPYTNDDRELVMKAVEHWSNTHGRHSSSSSCLDAPKGSSPFFAVQDIVQKLLKACNDETRKLIPQFKLQQRFKQRSLSEANQLPATYQWLLEQSTNGDKIVQYCLRMVHSKVTVMSEPAVDARSMLASLRSYKEAKKQRDLRVHPCSHSPKGEMEDNIKFVKDPAEGDEPLPEPYKDSDRELVKKAVSHWSKTHDQEAGPSGEAKSTKGERSKTTKNIPHQ